MMMIKTNEDFCRKLRNALEQNKRHTQTQRNKTFEMGDDIRIKIRNEMRLNPKT